MKNYLLLTLLLFYPIIFSQKTPPTRTSFVIEDSITHTKTNVIWGTINGEKFDIKFIII